MMEGEDMRHSAISILQSVKEQEAQFERLTQELEAERRSVADQLGNCKVGSQIGSVRSLNSTGVETNSFNTFIEQAPLTNGDESGHLMESCLKVLQERGIMQGDEVGSRGKTVAFGHSETHQYNGYDSADTSTQNSYRHAENSAMSRSQASYSLNSDANDYISYSQLSQRQHAEENGYDQDSRQPYVNIDSINSQRPLSEGDYVESDAVNYMNNYNYQPQPDTQHPHSRDLYAPQLSHSRPVNGDYVQQDGYPPAQQNNLYGERVDDSRRPSQYTQQLEDSDRASQASHDLVKDNQQGPPADQDLDQTLDSSGHFEPRNSIERLDSLGTPVNDTTNHWRSLEPPNRQERPDNYSPLGNMAAQRSHTPNYERSSSYNSGRGFKNGRQGELYGEERPNTGSYYSRQPSYNGQLGGGSSHPMLADPGLLYGSHNSLDSNLGDQQWRKPDLPEVIEYLRHPDNAVKANAAAYLQHLCYGNTSVKGQTRALKGIPALVDLLHNDIPEVHRNALGALLNLSRGYENDENKKAIKNCGGIEILAGLLERSRDNDVRELTTGILWNMSSLGELKKAVITSSLRSLVNSVISPAAGLSASHSIEASDIVWSTEFRNATGVLRNVSSDGLFARKQLRECDGLLESLLNVVQAVVGRAEMDNKHVENIVCTLRNLSFRLMEVDYPGYYEKKLSDLQESKKPAVQDLSILGCFGRSKQSSPLTIEYPCRTEVGRRKGEQLWQPELVDMYLPLLSDCSNTDTLEAAVGAVQNLTACEWQPSITFREQIRKKRGLPTIVELLGLEEADKVVCGAAIALRNLAIDKSNKTLIGKYAIQQLVSRLPPARGAGLERNIASEETIRAVLAALHEVLKDRDSDSVQHASTLVNDSDGLKQLMAIAKSQKQYMSKTLRCTHHLLTVLWRFTSLRDVYKSKGYKESDFLSKTMMPKSVTAGTGSVASTLTRPRSDPPSNTNTVARSNAAFREDKHDEKETAISYATSATLPIQRPLYDENEREPVRPQGNQSPSNHNKNPADLYAQIGSNRPRYNGSYRQEPLSRASPDYPNLLQSSHNFSQSQEGLIRNGLDDYGGQPKHAEPLYARVDKRKSANNSNNAFHNPNYNDAISMESFSRGDMYSARQTSPQDNAGTGVDSWV